MTFISQLERKRLTKNTNKEIMKIKKTFKKILIAGGLAAIIGVGIVLYIMFKPHRDVQATPADFNLTTTEIVVESLENSEIANGKYLSEDGDSKIMAITGTVASINEDFEGNSVLLLKEEGDKAGVECTFTKKTNEHAKSVKVGEKVTIKGVYRVAASYDEDFEEYGNVIVEESDIN